MFRIHQLPTTLNVMLIWCINICENLRNGCDEEGYNHFMNGSKWLMNLCCREFVVMFVYTDFVNFKTFDKFTIILNNVISWRFSNVLGASLGLSL